LEGELPNSVTELVFSTTKLPGSIAELVWRVGELPSLMAEFPGSQRNLMAMMMLRWPWKSWH
jgi:hypothetical protein